MKQPSLRKGIVAAIALCLFTLLLAWLVVALNTRGETDVESAALEPSSIDAIAASAQQIERGAYLARAGNCQSCHTQAGGAAYAGGEGIATPFGVVYASNLTPDKKTGLGTWNSAQFWRAMHHGRSKDGRLLYPAFPYAQLSLVTREDSDAIYNFLRTVPAVEQANREHGLGFPFNTQAALAVWRALYFVPLQFQPVAEKSVQWNRGRYLVEGLGHCAACHSPRNLLGATSASLQFSGGLMADGKWLAPSLLSVDEASVSSWPDAEVMQLLQAGVSKHAIVSGPMAKVVFGSTQYLNDDDLAAMASYLKSLPQAENKLPIAEVVNAGVMQRGAKLYEKQCAACHGEQGLGVAGIYPALKSNRTVSMQNPINLIRMTIDGGFAPATAKNPRPFGMPPFGHTLTDREIAELLSFIRQSWGNHASALTELEVMQVR